MGLSISGGGGRSALFISKVQKSSADFCFRQVNDYLCNPSKGRVAEWLGRALQKLVQRFESARDLDPKSRHTPAFFILPPKSSIFTIWTGSKLSAEDIHIPTLE